MSAFPSAPSYNHHTLIIRPAQRAIVPPARLPSAYSSFSATVDALPQLRLHYHRNAALAPSYGGLIT